MQVNGADSTTFIAEMCWRDFYAHVLFAEPRVAREAWRRDNDGIRWLHDADGLAAWKEGRTGYPIVDAAMRQLMATGWMHNRARMVAASFLVKHLLIDWREGEAHFMRHLVDGDPASNNGGWQWAASTGADAQPYFRIFNPVVQGQRYDPEGDYVRRWLPELAAAPVKDVHAPWTMPRMAQQAVACRIGRDYPEPCLRRLNGRDCGSNNSRYGPPFRYMNIRLIRLRHRARRTMATRFRPTPPTLTSPVPEKPPGRLTCETPSSESGLPVHDRPAVAVSAANAAPFTRRKIEGFF